MFAHPLDWSAVEKYDVLEQSLRGWVDRKVAEYLGETEAALTSFVLGKLRSKCSPETLLEEMRAVLDDDATPFVLKLWRMLIFSTLKFIHV